VFVTSVEGAFTKRITQTPEQERFVAFMPDGKSIVYASERDGLLANFKSTRVGPKSHSFCFNPCKRGIAGG